MIKQHVKCPNEILTFSKRKTDVAWQVKSLQSIDPIKNHGSYFKETREDHMFPEYTKSKKVARSG